MSTDELKKNEKNKKLKRGLSWSVLASSAVGTTLTAGIFATKIVTGDILGAASIIKSTIPVISNAIGLAGTINDMGNFLEKKLKGNKVLDGLSKVYQILTSRPAKLAYKAIGIGMAIAAATTPIGWGIIGLSIGATITSIMIGSRNKGRTNRIKQEIKVTEESLRGLGEVVQDKHPELDRFLAAKLNKEKLREVNGARVGAAVSRGNILESAALILEAAGDANSVVSAAMAGMAVFGNLAGETNEVIESLEKRNQLLFKRDELRARAVCATLALEPDINKMDQKALDAKYNEIYKANFSKSFGDKIKNVFKDIGSGIGSHLFGEISKIFNKTTEPERSSINSQVQVNNDKKNTELAQGKTLAELTPALDAHRLDIVHATQGNAHLEKTEHSPHPDESKVAKVGGKKSQSHGLGR